MKWGIKLWGITWDDGKGEYDVEDLPRNLEIEVEAESYAEAKELALSEASDYYGFLIEGTHSIEVELRPPTRPVRRDDLD